MRGFDFYKQWANKRDLYLEEILDHFRIQITAELHEVFIQMIAAVSQGTHQDLTSAIIRTSATRIARIIYELRQTAMEFTASTEAEILARITNEPIKAIPISIDRPLAGHGQVIDRVMYFLRKLYRKLENTADMYRSKGEEVPIQDLLMCLPKLKKLADTRRVLRKVKEAQFDDNDELLKDFSVQFLTDTDWDRIEAAYKRKYIPIGRDPDTFYFSGKGRRKEDRVYGWELENDIVYDFVQQVRDGQIAAANEAGIKDFVWISVIDNRTDDCCLWRDQLTTSEIEAQLKSKRKEDECQVVTPPAHPNCRCTLAPSGDELPDIPVSNRTEFEAWLET